MKGQGHITALAFKVIMNQQNSNVPCCQEKGCTRPAIMCTYVHDGSHVYYCPGHAADNGFCACCGIYSDGTEAFIFSDLCENCQSNVDADGLDDTNLFDDDNY